MTRRELEELVRHAIDRANEMLPKETQLAADDGTVLFGAEGKLDSLGTVNSLLTIEEHILAESGASPGLSDLLIEANLDAVATFRDLCDFIAERLGGIPA